LVLLGRKALERRAINRAIAVGVLAIALLVVCFIVALQNFGSASEQRSINELSELKSVTLVNNTISTATPSPVSKNSSFPELPEIKNDDVKSNGLNYYSSHIEQPTVNSSVMLTETYLLKAISALGATGGQIVLENNLVIEDQDVLIPSNVAITGADPGITIFLEGKTLRVAANATNVTLKDLTIDFYGLENRYGLVYGENATNVQLKNIDFYNYDGPGCLLVMGNQVVWALIAVGGGVSNISITNNSAINRPLLNANYGTLPTTNLSIENNVVYFPNGTYGLLVMGGLGDSIQAPHENVTVKGNFVTAGRGAFNAIAIYGLTRNALVINNTVDMSQSGHNAIGISSGVNVTVVGNVVFGCTELTEGGIEVESNPVHNRRVGFSENVTVTGNTVYNCDWGIYVRVMCPDHPNWNGTILISKNIVIENNSVSSCHVGVNLLYGINLIVRNNDLVSNIVPFSVDVANVYNFTVTGNLGYP
jgi:hypothetical protein